MIKYFIQTRARRDILQHAIPTTNRVESMNLFAVKDELYAILSVGVCIEVKLRKPCNIEQMNCDKNCIHKRDRRDVLQHSILTSNPEATHGFI